MRQRLGQDLLYAERLCRCAIGRETAAELARNSNQRGARMRRLGLTHEQRTGLFRHVDTDDHEICPAWAPRLGQIS